MKYKKKGASKIVKNARKKDAENKSAKTWTASSGNATFVLSESRSYFHCC